MPYQDLYTQTSTTRFKDQWGAARRSQRFAVLCMGLRLANSKPHRFSLLGIDLQCTSCMPGIMHWCITEFACRGDAISVLKTLVVAERYVR